MCSTLLLLPALQKWRLGFLVSLYLLSRIYPNCACTQLCLVPHSFLVFCCRRTGVSRCKHCSKGSQVPACLKGSCEEPRKLWSVNCSCCFDCCWWGDCCKNTKLHKRAFLWWGQKRKHVFPITTEVSCSYKNFSLVMCFVCCCLELGDDDLSPSPVVCTCQTTPSSQKPPAQLHVLPRLLNGQKNRDLITEESCCCVSQRQRHTFCYLWLLGHVQPLGRKGSFTAPHWT